jgi:chemotaxis methyl-accepting protein methylase
MRHLYSMPKSASFFSTGLTGYNFGPLNDPDIDVFYVDVSQGHDTFQISRKIARIYYVLSGSGYFTIAGQRYDVVPGNIVEVPPGLEYSYSGKMQVIAFATPRWFPGNDTATKWNPDVVPQSVIFEPGNGVTWSSRLLGFQILGKSPSRAFFRFNHDLWQKLPAAVTSFPPMRLYGAFVNNLARKGNRAQGLGTCFFRNRPALELIRRMADRKGHGETLKVAILGSSTGAEVYSIAWRIKSVRPDLKLELRAMDISSAVVEFASRGVYTVKSGVRSSDLEDPAILERMTNAEVVELFDQESGAVKVKPWIKEGIHWQVGDAGNPDLAEAFGPQDIVVANNFLCHMQPGPAQRCLRNIARLVGPQGYLFVAGIDLDVRTQVARELRWRPVEELLEEIHEGDKWLRQLWPGHYAGLEPLIKRKKDWKLRYAAVFQPVQADARTKPDQLESAGEERAKQPVSSL